MKKIILAAALVALASCTKDETYYAENSSVATFRAADIDTRVSADGTKWVYGDQIGITMFSLSTTAETNDTETIAESGDNIAYETVTKSEYGTLENYTGATAASVSFTPVFDEQALIYPNSGSVRFYAYYPYQSTTAETYLYSADVSDQSKDIDFMVAEPITTTRTSNSQVLNFSHKLSKLTISIKGNENVANLTSVKASISGLNTIGSYSIKDGKQSGELSDTKPIDFVMSYGTTDATSGYITSATATAIILPEELKEASTVTFILGERTFSVELASGTEFASGNNHTYSVALGNDYAYFTSGSTIGPWTTDDSETPLYSEETVED